MPTGDKRPLSEVDAVLTESMQTSDSSGLEQRMQALEDKVKMLENRK
jgi:hypothetical protein